MNTTKTENVIITEHIARLGKTINNLISNNSLKKSDIAEATGLSANTVNNIIAGKNPTLSSILLVANALGYNLQELVNLDFDNHGPFPVSPNTKPMATNTQAVVKEVEEVKASPQQVAMRTGLPLKTIKELVEAKA